MKIPYSFATGFRLFFVLTAFVTFAGCGTKENATTDTPKTVADYFNIRIGDKTPRLQFAVLPLEQQQGLMYRRDLGADDGMIFVYASTQQMGFWMRNTPTPLDIGFFDAKGKLLEIYPMYPLDENSVRSRSDEIKFAVEMNQGWFKANNVRAGATLDMKAVAEAMKARGFTLQDYHIGSAE